MRYHVHSTAAMLLSLTVLNIEGVVAGELSGAVSVLSKYKYSGGDQNFYEDKSFDPALQFNVMYAFDNGLYVGNWASTTRLVNKNWLDSTAYAGYRFALGPGKLDLSIGYNFYPDAAYANTTFAYATYYWSYFAVKYASVISQKWFGIDDGFGRQSVALAASTRLTDKIVLSGEVGRLIHSAGLREQGFKDKSYYLVQTDYLFQDGWSAAVAYTGASTIGGPNVGYRNKGRFVFSLTKTF